MLRTAIFVLIGHTVFLSGCATNSYQLMQQNKQELQSQSVIELIASKLEALEERVSKAQANDVVTYAPYQMDKALDSLASARRSYEQFLEDPNSVNESVSLFFGETQGQSTLAKIETANAALAQAEENKRQADLILAKSNENFVWLKKFGAQIHFKYAYSDVERAHSSLVSLIANGNIDKARSRVGSLVNEQRALEVVSAQHFYLNDLNKRIQNPINRDLNRYAALSYGSSLSALNRAKVIIAKNTRDEATIIKAKNEAEFSFEVATAVSRDMKKLSNMNRTEMERWLLLLTAKLNHAGKQLGAEDLRNHSILHQLDVIAAIAKDQSELPSSNQAIASVPAAVSPEQVATDDVSVDSKDQTTLVNRVSQLEATLTKQIKALTEQMKTMQALNQSASITDTEPTEVQDSHVPLGERRSLFSY